MDTNTAETCAYCIGLFVVGFSVFMIFVEIVDDPEKWGNLFYPSRFFKAIKTINWWRVLLLGIVCLCGAFWLTILNLTGGI